MADAEKVKNAITKLKDIMKKGIDTDKHGPDYDKIEEISFSEHAELVRKMIHASDSEEETLKMHGRTTQTMTMDDWHSHLSNVADLVVTYVRMYYWLNVFRFMENKEREDARMRENANELAFTHEQFKLYAKDVFSKSYCNFVLARDAALRNCLKLSLPKSMYFEALLLVLELIIESSTFCNSVEEMKEWIENRIDERCDVYFQHYASYLAGPKRGRSSSLNVDGANKLAKLS